MPYVEKFRFNADGSCWTRLQWYVRGVRQTPVTVRAATKRALEKEVDAERGRLTHEIHLHKTRATNDTAGIADATDCDDLLREWLRLYVAVELTGDTPLDYANDAADYFAPFWQGRALSTLRPEHGYEWRSWLLETIRAGGNSRLGDYEHAGHPRVNRLLTMGMSIFSFGVKMRWMKEENHPLKGVSFLPYIPPSETDDFLFEPELAEAIRLVIAQTRPQHLAKPVLQMEARLVVSCSCYLALPQQDLFNAHWKQALNPDGTPRDYFEVPRRPSGSARKSRNRKRSIPVPRQVQEELAALWRARGCPSLDDLIIPNGAGKPYSRHNWRRDFLSDSLAAVKELRVETVPGGSPPSADALVSTTAAGELPRFHDLPAGKGIGLHSGRRCAVRMWTLAGWQDIEVLEAIGHEARSDKTLFRFYKKAKREVPKRRTFVSLEDQIEAAREIYSSQHALAERDRVLAGPRARAEQLAARQRAGRAADRREAASGNGAAAVSHTAAHQLPDPTPEALVLQLL